MPEEKDDKGFKVIDRRGRERRPLLRRLPRRTLRSAATEEGKPSDAASQGEPSAGG